MTETVKEVLQRPFHAGSRVTNCVLHMSKPLTERPDDCKLCLQDLRNQLSFAIRVNEFLNKKVDDALAVLNQPALSE